jgi:excisionase family DNA binding protein
MVSSRSAEVRMVQKQLGGDMEATHEARSREPLLLRIHPDATRLTSLGRTTLYAEIAAGRLRAVKFGRAVRIRRDDLEACIEKHTTAESEQVA